MVGLMNTSAQVGGLLGSIAYGYIVAGTGSYDAPFIPMAILLFVGALLWLKIDASKDLDGNENQFNGLAVRALGYEATGSVVGKRGQS